VNLCLRVAYRKIYINGLENIKSNKAYLVTANHPSGFMEPLIMACLFPRDLYFITRGDLFANPFYNFVFKATHQIPIFRFKDGFSNLRHNQESVRKAVDTIKERKALLIFAEGSTKYCFFSRPLQKGFLRMGFQALAEDKNLEIDILPVGLTFNYVDKFGSDVIMNIGESFSLNSFFDPSDDLNAKGTRTAIQATEEAMGKLLPNARTEEEIAGLRNYWSKLSKDESIFPRVDNNSDFFVKLSSEYKLRLGENNSFTVNGKYYPWLLAVSPLAIPSLILTAIPRQLMSYYENKKVKNIEFAFAVMFAVGVISYILLFTLISILITVFLGWKLGILFILLLIISGFFQIMISENLKRKKS
jgi:1-acyl-sn-glycerol-3-phosphate acyltransferase